MPDLPSSRPPQSSLIYSPQFTQYHYGPTHPLKTERLYLTYRLIEAYRLLDLEGAEVREPRWPQEEELLAFHSRDYLEALRLADGGKSFSSALAHGLDTPDNPIFPGVSSWSLLVTGASLAAAEAIEEGGRDFAFSMAGGLHHAHAARASGFCYLNDPAVMIYYLLQRGRRIAYLDLDAHHGDGVQEAFYGTDQVLTISFHESGRTLFPGTGFAWEQGEGKGRGYAVNVPLDVGTDDETFRWAFEEIVPPLLASFRPDILVTQLGTDAHRSDPLANLSLTVQGFAGVVSRIRRTAGKWIALGGGGYNLNAVPRVWTLVWAIMNDRELDSSIPPDFLEFARPYGFTETSLWDAPVSDSASRRKTAGEFAREQVAIIKKSVFPIHGLKG